MANNRYWNLISNTFLLGIHPRYFLILLHPNHTNEVVEFIATKMYV